MPKITIAGLTAQLEEMTRARDTQAEKAAQAGAKVYAAERERDEARKERDGHREDAKHWHTEAMKLRGMIEMLERMGTIPKTEQPHDYRDEFGRPRVY